MQCQYSRNRVETFRNSDGILMKIAMEKHWWNIFQGFQLFYVEMHTIQYEQISYLAKSVYIFWEKRYKKMKEKNWSVQINMAMRTPSDFAHRFLFLRPK